MYERALSSSPHRLPAQLAVGHVGVWLLHLRHDLAAGRFPNLLALKHVDVCREDVREGGWGGEAMSD